MADPAGSDKPKRGKGKPGPKPDPSRVRDAVTILRSREDWKAWVAGLAEFDRASSVSELVDRAVVSYARERGYKEPAPKR